MGSQQWVRGARIIASAPWSAVLAATATAVVLFVVATLAHGTSLALIAALLALSACGGASAYVLDEEAALVADSTPTSRRLRAAWRMPAIAVPAAVAMVGLLGLDLVDPPSHWLRLVPLAAGALAGGLAAAAVLRRTESATPGDLAGTLTVATTILVVAADPLRRWVALAPIGDTPHAGRSTMLWAVAVGAFGVVTLVSTRDPAHRRSPARRSSQSYGLSRAQDPISSRERKQA